MTLFQISASLFGLWMMYEIYIHRKKRVVSVTELSFWLSLWFIFVVIALFPNLLIGIAHNLRFTRVFDLLLVGALMVLTVMIYTSYFNQKETAHKLEQMIRDLAIKEVKTKNTVKAKGPRIHAKTR